MAGGRLTRRLPLLAGAFAVLATLALLTAGLAGLSEEIEALLAALPGDEAAARVGGLLASRLLVGAAAVLVLGLPALIFLTVRLARPLQALAAGAERMAAGEAEVALPTLAAGDVGRAARALRQLDDQARAGIESLRLDRNRLAAVLAGMVEGVVAVDEGERVVHLNAAATRILRTPQGGMVGRRIWEVTRIGAVGEALAETVETSRDVTREVTVQAGPRKQVLQLLTAPLADTTGRPAGAVLVLHDITSLRRLEEARKEFVANVSHELKTPLTAIAAMVEVLLEDEQVDAATRRRFLGKVRAQTGRLTAMVRDLLDLSRIESGDIRATFEPLDLGVVIRQAVHLLEGEAGRAEVAVSMSLPAGPLTMLGDERALGRMLGNLLENAIKYTAAGGHVEVRARREGERLVVEVQDDGIGIEERHHERIFERFYRADQGRSRQVGGTGLGLSIVKHVVVAHGGEVTVESSAGEGSTFRAVLPTSQERVD